MTALLVAAGAAVGASLRYLVATRLDGAFPRGTLAVNTVGSLLLGMLSALALSGSAWALLATGFCGGLTTYSAFAVQAHGLGVRRGSAYAVVTVGLWLGACALGFWIGAQA